MASFLRSTDVRMPFEHAATLAAIHRPAALCVDGTRPPAPNRSSTSEMRLACPPPERGTNGTESSDSEPDALNAPDGARIRFQGVARNMFATTPIESPIGA